ncbi:unnamed protein product [Cylicocyclus nassatus]|uniref:Uncharacterized protein n=1 Tax=Cylicocyclus nassatus TaxID=53992 RepID=A0AA36GP09_CYLNA|nr:unnamed protein product [Cylicocyclus nassatus]
MYIENKMPRFKDGRARNIINFANENEEWQVFFTLTWSRPTKVCQLGNGRSALVEIYHAMKEREFYLGLRRRKSSPGKKAVTYKIQHTAVKMENVTSHPEEARCICTLNRDYDCDYSRNGPK